MSETIEKAKKKKANEITYNEVLFVKGMLEALQHETAQRSFVMPGRMSYALHRNIEKLESVWMQFEHARQKAVEPYIERGEDGKPVMAQDDKGNPTGKMKVSDQKGMDKVFAEFTTMTKKVDLYQFVDLELMIDEVKGEHKAMDILWQVVDWVNQKIDNKILKPA